MIESHFYFIHDLLKSDSLPIVLKKILTSASYDKMISDCDDTSPEIFPTN